jgi:geranylgeranyl diphosphate synthase type I
MNIRTPVAHSALQHAKTIASALLDPGDALGRVESRMQELAGNRLDDPGARMVHSHLETGGKRLRARLALGACEALDAPAEHAIDWAAAVELLHNASLVHDDVQDGDRTRRGKPALWATVGAAQAINAGDLLLMLPFVALGSYPAPTQAALVQLLASYAERTARGQIRELDLTGSPEEGWSGYLRAVSGKTGTLFALPVHGAAELAGLSPKAARDLAGAFSSIGVLYQLQDDLLDLFDAKGRRPRGSDIFEGRVSAVLLTHLDLHDADSDDVLAIIKKPREATTQAQVRTVIDRFVQDGAAGQLLTRIEHLATELLRSDALQYSKDIHALATTLVARVLAPLEALKGGLHD